MAVEQGAAMASRYIEQAGDKLEQRYSAADNPRQLDPKTKARCKPQPMCHLCCAFTATILVSTRICKQFLRVSPQAGSAPQVSCTSCLLNRGNQHQGIRSLQHWQASGNIYMDMQPACSLARHVLIEQACANGSLLFKSTAQWETQVCVCTQDQDVQERRPQGFRHCCNCCWGCC